MSRLRTRKPPKPPEVPAADEPLNKWSANEPLKEHLQSVLVAAFNGKAKQFSEWAKLDRAITAQKDRDKGDGGRLDETQEGQDYLDDINVPHLFLLEDTLNSQFSKIFFSRDSVWTYDGVTGDDKEGARAHTVFASREDKLFGNSLEMKYTTSAAIRYGFGVTMLGWKVLSELKYKPLGERGRAAIPTPTFAGVKLTNISPYRFLHDPLVPLDRAEKGRFMGHWEVMSRNDIQREYGVRLPDNTSLYWLFLPLQDQNILLDTLGIQKLDNRMCMVAHIYVDLVPADLGLGKSTKPEVWHFVLAGRDIVLKAQPANLPVGRYPYQVNVLDGDGYHLTPISRLDLVKDLQTYMNWLFNSHRYGVEASLEGNWIVDPSIINMKTVENRNRHRPSNVFLVNPHAYGLPGAVQNGIRKLETKNDTQNHFQVIDFLGEFTKTSTGAVDTLSGTQDAPNSRRTAEEIATMRQAAGDRIQAMAGRMHDAYMVPLGYKRAKYVQALLDLDLMLRVASDSSSPAQLVPWQDFLVDLDVNVGDGYLSFDQTGLVNSWTTIIQTVFQNPTLMTAFNVVEILKEYGTVMGIKNMDRFLSKGGAVLLKAQAAQALGQPAQAQ